MYITLFKVFDRKLEKQLTALFMVVHSNAWVYINVTPSSWIFLNRQKNVMKILIKGGSLLCKAIYIKTIEYNLN